MSEVCIEFTATTSVDGSNHVLEFIHANFWISSFSEHTIIELCFVFLSVIKGIFDFLPYFSKV